MRFWILLGTLATGIAISAGLAFADADDKAMEGRAFSVDPCSECEGHIVGGRNYRTHTFYQLNQRDRDEARFREALGSGYVPGGKGSDAVGERRGP